MATIRFKNGMEATVRDLLWESPNSDLEGLLNRMTPKYGIPGSEHNPDMWLAEQAVNKIGGEIIKRDPEMKLEQGLIY